MTCAAFIFVAFSAGACLGVLIAGILAAAHDNDNGRSHR
jgi:hypothetical protein